MVKIPIVDESDNILYLKERGDISLKEIYRVSACWILNSKGEILLAQRAYTKKNNPWKWWPAVAWTVEWKETYLENILREIHEEIWIKLSSLDLKEWPYYLSTSKHNHFTKWFVAKLDLAITEFKKEDEEVESIKWRSKDQIKTEYTTSPDSFLKVIWNHEEIFAEFIDF